MSGPRVAGPRTTPARGADCGDAETAANGADTAQRRLARAQREHLQKMQCIGQLAAGIAHEINTPTQYVGDNLRFVQDAFEHLNKLLVPCQELLQGTAAGQAPGEIFAEVQAAARDADLPYLLLEIPRALEQSLEGIERVAEIVRAMKEFAHPHTGERTVVDLNKAILSTITVARHEWKYVADVVTDLDPSLPPILGLPGEINQVLLNVLVNAAHAIADVVREGVTGRGMIRISTRQAGDETEIRVSDTGKGIPESIRARIFEPFFTTKPPGKGTGQGLALARTIVADRHGGSIRFESEVGKGTTFVIRLPTGAGPLRGGSADWLPLHALRDGAARLPAQTPREIRAAQTDEQPPGAAPVASRPDERTRPAAARGAQREEAHSLRG